MWIIYLYFSRDCCTHDSYEAPDHATHQRSPNPVICNTQVNCPYKLQEQRGAAERDWKLLKLVVKQLWLIIKCQSRFGKFCAFSCIKMLLKYTSSPTQLIWCGRSWWYLPMRVGGEKRSHTFCPCTTGYFKMGVTARTLCTGTPETGVWP